MSHFGETILNSSTLKFEHNLAMLPTLSVPLGSTKMILRLKLVFLRFNLRN